MTLQLYGYLSALLISIFGSSLSMIAIPWFLLETTGNVMYTSIVLGIRLFPLILSLFYGSRFIDSFFTKLLTVCSTCH